MSSLFSRELAALTSDSKGPECGPLPSASANLPHSIGSASIGRKSRSSMMSAPFQASLFEEPLTSSQADSLVSRSASPGGRKVRRTSATSGLISHASSEKSDPVGYWLRTYLASELSRLTSSSKTWKNSGTPHGRSWWVLTTLEPRTVAKGCGLLPGTAVKLWPTATAGDAGMSGSAGYSTASGRHAGTTLTDAASGLWAHTAGLLDQESRSTIGKRPDWPTPRSNRHGAPDSHGKSPIRGALNPAWVTQLMGYPDGWLDTPPPTAAKPSRRLETRSSRKSSRSSDGQSSRRTK